MRKLLFLFFITLSTYHLNAQNSGFNYYDTDDGLPSSEVYRVFSDKSGRLWFCTDRGIAFYDSYKFTKIDIPENDQVILDGYCDENGTCWFQSTKNNIYFISNKLNNVIKYNYNSNKKINSFFWQDNSLYLQLVSEHSELLLKHNKYSGKIDTLALSNNFTKPTNVNSIQYDVLYNKSTSRAIFSYSSYTTKIKDTIIYNNNRLTLRLNTISAKPSFGLNLSIHCLEKRSLLVNNNGDIYIIDLNKKTTSKLLTTDIHSGGILAAISLKNSLICTNSYKDIETIKDNGKSSIKNTLRTVISSITKDRENNLWFSTLEKGCFVESMFKPTAYLYDQNITALRKVNNQLAVGLKSGELNLITPELGKAYQTIAKSNSAINSMQFYKGLICVQGEIIDPKTKGTINLKNNWISSDFIFQQSYYHIFKNKISKYNSLSKKNTEVYNYSDKIISSLALKNTILLSTENKLIEYNPAFKTSKILYNSKTRITSIKEFKNYLILTTLGEGIYLFDPILKRTIKQYSEQFPSKNTFASIVQNDSIIWIASNRGLIRLTVGINLKQKSIAYFDKSNGLPSNEINCLEIDSTYLYIGTAKGLATLDYKNLDIPDTKPIVSINNINTIASEPNFSLKTEFQHNENNIRINFSAFIMSKSLTEPTYQYCLLYNNSDTQWLYTNETTLQFTNLEPGNYTFLIRARSRFSKFGPFASHHFSITPHFTQTLWFKFLIALAILVALFLIVFFRIQNIRNRAKFSQTIKSSQLDSLRNQMNPHFIFNALNSVQSLIYGNKVDDAGNFLGKVSRMFRDALEFSRTSKISLSIEIEFIERYLQIEKLRFPNKLTYQIVIDPELVNQTEIYEIPPLLMQPLVENSVKHGLKNIDHVGNVIVQMIKMEDAILYSVEDNCLGIPEQTSQTHTSRGLSIIKDRINILNQLEKHNTPFQFELINMPGKGVKATLTIPID